MFYLWFFCSFSARAEKSEIIHSFNNNQRHMESIRALHSFNINQRVRGNTRQITLASKHQSHWFQNSYQSLSIHSILTNAYVETRDRLHWHQNIKVTDFKIRIRALPTQPRFRSNVDRNDFHCFICHAWKPYLTEQPTNVQRVHFRVAHVPITSIRGETPKRPFWVWC